MYKIKVVLADPDNIYVDKVAEYINSTYPAQVRLSAFTKAGLMEDFLASSPEKIDILLAHPKFLRAAQHLLTNVGLVVGLSDGSMAGEFTPTNCVNKFLPGDRLVNQLLNFYAEKTPKAAKVLNGSRQTTLVSVFSPAGGTGKTSVALGLAAKLGERGKAVLVLSLEGINSMAATLACTGNDALTHLLLSLRENEDTFPLKVETYKTRDRLFSFDFIEPCEFFTELHELNSEDLRLLLERLKQMGRFDVIITDMDMVTDQKALCVFACSDRVVLVQTPDNICRFKTETFYHQMTRTGMAEETRLLEKLVTVVNRFDGRPVVEGPAGNVFYVPVLPGLWVEGDDKYMFDPGKAFGSSLQELAASV